MPELFGTDGIRGRAYEEPLDEATVRRLGAALARRLGGRGRVLLAGDTRASTRDLAAWLGEALAGGGLEVVWAGVLPTPAVSHLVRAGGFDLGVVISASHNPAHDNGIKVLARSGEKLPEAEEEAVEALMAAGEPGTGPPLPPADPSFAERYLGLLEGTLGGGRPLGGLDVVLDAAHGAAWEIG
ncbi:MAG: phosphoglucosamine mutase, partial [Nitrospirae bacterium]